MKKTLFFALIFSLLYITVDAQQSTNWRTSTLQDNSNYFDVVSKTRANLKLNKSNTLKSRKAHKQFERWAAFWKDRILPNGNFISEQHTVQERAKAKKCEMQISCQNLKQPIGV